MALHFDIDAHGRVIPQSDSALCALADRAGRFVLLPSTSDLLVARRAQAVGATSERPRCVLAGDLSAFPIADFIAFLHHSRLSGALHVSSCGAERSITFQDGEVRSAQSSAAGERIGEVAIRLGYVTEAQVAEASGSHGPVGKALVDLGMKPSELYRCLHEQVVAVFHALLLCKSGTFVMVDEEPEHMGTPLSVSTQSLLLDGIRRIDELSLFRARIPGPDASLRRRDPSSPTTLRPTENALLAFVDGRRTVAEIAMAARLNEFDTTKILFHLAEAGYVEALAAAPGVASHSERVSAIVAGMNELLRAVAQAIPADARAAFIEAAQAFLWEDSTRWAPLVRGIPVTPDGSLDEAALQKTLAGLGEAALVAMHAAATPPRVVFEAMREALCFWLFLSGDRIGRGADESLGRAVKQKLPQLEALAMQPAP